VDEVMDVERVTLGSATVSLIADKDRIVIGLRAGKQFEPLSRMLWAEWCKDGGTVIDVGAYDGFYSIGAALHGCYAIGFEPMKFNHARALANAKLNNVHIGCIRAAAADKIGRAQLAFNPKVEFTSGASLINRKTGYQRIWVETGTIDSLQALKTVVNDLKAIKIDVERAEPLVLKGAQATLERFRPNLLVESLGDIERSTILAHVPGYRLADVIDNRNLVLLPA
jgi:FkbM family methyltransferase